MLKVGQKIQLERQAIYADSSRIASSAVSTKEVASIVAGEYNPEVMLVEFKGIKGFFRMTTSRDGSVHTFTRNFPKPLKYKMYI